jgi:hypothetical protein
MTQPSSKRKRASDDIGRSIKDRQPMPDTSDETFSQVLLQGIDSQDMDNQRVAAVALGEEFANTDQFDATATLPDFGPSSPPQSLNTPQQPSVYAGTAPTPGRSLPSANKDDPQWHQQRKDSHKEGKHLRKFPLIIVLKMSS